MESQRFPPQDLRAQQLHQLEQLVRFARAKTAFYSHRLDAVFRPDGTFDINAWHSVPILTRSDLSNHGESLLPREILAGHGATRAFLGSGSTGTPVTTRHNELASRAFLAATYRAWQNLGIDFSKNFFSYHGTELNEARAPDGANTGPWGPPWQAESAKGSLIRLHHMDSAEQAVALMQRVNPAYAAGRPHDLHQLAKVNHAQRRSVRLEHYFAFGANLSDDMRAECEEIFGGQMHNRYASKEAYDITFECPHRKLHVNAELMLFEVLDDTGKACEVGQPGRAIVTPFYSTAQPLIRYDLGDIVTMGPPCSCGRSLPVIEELHGRTIHAFRLSDGRKVTPRLHGIVRRKIGSAQWQIAQVAPELVEIRYVKTREVETREFAELTQTIQAQLTPRVEVRYVAMLELPRAPSGKILEVVCELPADETKSHG